MLPVHAAASEPVRQLADADFFKFPCAKLRKFRGESPGIPSASGADDRIYAVILDAGLNRAAKFKKIRPSIGFRALAHRLIGNLRTLQASFSISGNLRRRFALVREYAVCCEHSSTLP
jgi:hypothetical protein